MTIHNIPFVNMNKKNSIHYPKSAAMACFQGTQERVRNSRDTRAISVRAIEVLLYYTCDCRQEMEITKLLRL